MAKVTRKAERIPSVTRGFSLPGTIAVVVGAFAVAVVAAVWTKDFGPVGWRSGTASSKDTSTSSFDDRFAASSARDLLASRALVRSLPSAVEIKIQQAKDRLAQILQSQDFRLASVEELKPAVVEQPKPSVGAGIPLPTGIPIPRPRPVEASLDVKNDVAGARAEIPVARADNRSLLQKFSDLMPGRVTLASLTPGGGLFSKGPDLAALGYDSVTAVYDISAHAVYMPDGTKLEAHSGYGSLMDDPAHVSEHNIGATPPNVYDLKPREAMFHGVQALRMVPAGDSDMLGRSGLLTHGYMLGPNGDSNGCVSIKYYDKFLKAYSDGNIKRLVVVSKIAEST
jgi:hypothetical protein